MDWFGMVWIDKVEPYQTDPNHTIPKNFEYLQFPFEKFFILEGEEVE